MEAALDLVAAEGSDALTMRHVTAALETGSASLYTHVRDKADLDDLLIGELWARVVLPAPDPTGWLAQFEDVCGQLRDQYLRYPDVAQATFTLVPRSLDTLRISEAMLARIGAAHEGNSFQRIRRSRGLGGRGLCCNRHFGGIDVIA